MAFNKERVAATYAKEILRTVSGSEIAENSVIDGTQVPLNADGRRIVETGTVMVFVGVNEKQTVTISATGGTFTITFPFPAAGAVTTAGIAFDATAAVAQAAIDLVLGVGNTIVTKPSGTVFQIEYTGIYGSRDLAQVTTGAGSLTGGAGTATPATGTAGGSAQARGQKVRPAPASGVAAGGVAGILMHTTEFWFDATAAYADDAPVALFTQNCDFDTTQLTGYSGNSSAVQTAMTGGGSGSCANCKFST